MSLVRMNGTISRLTSQRNRSGYRCAHARWMIIPSSSPTSIEQRAGSIPGALGDVLEHRHCRSTFVLLDHANVVAVDPDALRKLFLRLGRAPAENAGYFAQRARPRSSAADQGQRKQ